MFKGVISYTPKTKIIATDTEKIQGSLGLYKWADLKNKKELSRAINIASQYCAEDNLNLENILHLILIPQTPIDRIHSLPVIEEMV